MIALLLFARKRGVFVLKIIIVKQILDEMNEQPDCIVHI